MSQSEWAGSLRGIRGASVRQTCDDRHRRYAQGLLASTSGLAWRALQKQGFGGFYPQSQRRRLVVHDTCQESCRIGIPWFGALRCA